MVDLRNFTIISQPYGIGNAMLSLNLDLFIEIQIVDIKRWANLRFWFNYIILFTNNYEFMFCLGASQNPDIDSYFENIVVDPCQMSMFSW